MNVFDMVYFGIQLFGIQGIVILVFITRLLGQLDLSILKSIAVYFINHQWILLEINLKNHRGFSFFIMQRFLEITWVVCSGSFMLYAAAQFGYFGKSKLKINPDTNIVIKSHSKSNWCYCVYWLPEGSETIVSHCSIRPIEIEYIINRKN